MEYLIERILSQASAEVGKGAIGRGFHEVEATKEAQPGVIEKGSGKLAIRFDLAQVDEELCLEQLDGVITIRSLRRILIVDQGMDE